MNIYKRYQKGLGLIELLISIAVFSIAIVGIYNASSSIYNYFQGFNVKQDSEIMYHLFKEQLKLDLVEIGRNNIVAQDDNNNAVNQLLIQYSMWNNAVNNNAKNISYTNRCVPDDQVDYPVVPGIVRFNNNNVNIINNLISAKMQEFGNGCQNFNVCGEYTLPVIVRTENNNNVLVNTTYYPVLSTELKNISFSGTISAAMCNVVQDDGVKLFILRVFPANASEGTFNIKEDVVSVSFNDNINILKR